jgi:Holliday junction resolvase RusA-like endonuclease
MTKQEKFKSKLNDSNYLFQTIVNYEKNKNTIELNFVKEGQPVNYVRERYTGRGHRFYNAKAGIMKDMNKYFISMIPKEHKDYLQNLLANPEAVYNVKIYADFYVKTPNADSVETKVLKEKKVIRPTIAPDTDNYVKLLLDTLHGVAYDDDKRVVSITAHKYYSIDPKTEVKIVIEVIEK